MTFHTVDGENPAPVGRLFSHRGLSVKFVQDFVSTVGASQPKWEREGTLVVFEGNQQEQTQNIGWFPGLGNSMFLNNLLVFQPGCSSILCPTLVAPYV